MSKTSIQVRNYRTLLRNKQDYSNISLKFINFDNSIRVMETNLQFFQNENGKTLTPNSIMENINALKHDMGAKRVLIQS